MRKESRQMSAGWALEVFDKAAYITVSMTGEDGNHYGLPLSLVRSDEKTFWFHCATEGKKLEILKANPKVFLSAVTKCRPLRGPKDGSFTLEFQSATAVGVAEIIEDEVRKIEALRAICHRFLPRQMEGFEESVTRSLHKTAVVRISLTEPPVGKRKQYDANGDEMKYGRME
ncbi:MAG: pyridoxamine 5'-phosphate oxidase family protein [Candidatus Cryptobacteroides sp.]